MNFEDIDDNSSFGGGPRRAGGGQGLGGLFDADGPPPFSGDNSSFKFEQPAQKAAPAPTTATAGSSGGSTVIYSTQGQMTIYDSANKPLDKGAVGVAVIAATDHHVFLVYGADKKPIAEAVVGEHMQAKVDNEVYIVYYDNAKRFCCLRLANQAAAGECLSQINNSIRTTTPIKTSDLEAGEGSTVAEEGFEVKVHYNCWLQNPDGSAGSLIGSSESGKPIAFKIGAGQILGFNKAVVGMRKLGKRRVTMPTALAAGAIGVQAAPPNSLLIFEVAVQALRKPEHLRKSKSGAAPASPAPASPAPVTAPGTPAATPAAPVTETALVLHAPEAAPQQAAAAPPPQQQQYQQPPPAAGPPQQQPPPAQQFPVPPPGMQYYGMQAYPPTAYMQPPPPAAWAAQAPAPSSQQSEIMSLLSTMSGKLDVLTQRANKSPELQLSRAFQLKDEQGITGEQVIAAVTRMVEKDEAPSDNMAADYITLLKFNMANMSDKNEKLKAKLDAVEKQLSEMGAEAADASGSSEELEQMQAQHTNVLGAMEGLKSRSAELEAEIQEMREDKQGVEEDLDCCREEVATLAAKLAEAEQQLQQTLDDAEAEKAAAEEAAAEEPEKEPDVSSEQFADMQQKLDEAQQELASVRTQMAEAVEAAKQQGKQEGHSEATEAAVEGTAAAIREALQQASVDMASQVEHWLGAAVSKFEKKIKEGEDYHGHQVHTCLKAIVESQSKKAHKEIDSIFKKKIEEFNTTVSNF